jgi:hypothetical protein
MARKRMGRKRNKATRLRGKHCCGCSILSWEQKKFDKFHELYFSETLRETAFEQYLLVAPTCIGGVQCQRCANFLCHDCVCALHTAIKADHPNLQDSWVQATMNSSAECILRIPVGHCCILKDQQEKAKHHTTLLSPTMDPVLAGAVHYYQYDLAIGSTPSKCVDVFSLGAAGSNAPVTHAVFPIQIALDMANENHIIPLLPLDGPTLTLHSKLLPSLPKGFNKTSYQVKVVTINRTRTNTPFLGKIYTCV